jgi:hypothetical protein
MFLSVTGRPTVEIEEAIFKLSLRMEERARKEGKRAEKVAGEVVVGIGMSPRKTEWFYTIQIHKCSASAGQASVVPPNLRVSRTAEIYT